MLERDASRSLPRVAALRSDPQGIKPMLPTSTSARTRSGRSQARVATVCPPNDVPTSTAVSAPIRSRNPSTKRAYPGTE